MCALYHVGRQSDAPEFAEAKTVYDEKGATCNIFCSLNDFVSRLALALLEPVGNSLFGENPAHGRPESAREIGLGLPAFDGSLAASAFFEYFG